MTHYLPNKSIEERGLKNHLIHLGIDYKLFTQFIDAEVPITNIRMFFKKSDGKLYSRPTIAHWVKIYKQGK